MNTFENRELLPIVTVGHVDHGKSTVIGRLLADTGSLPEGKLEQVKASCKAGARPFEYSFLLDALKDEQSQGITIDAARCFFKTEKRNYLLIDAPGHIEFLKNMVTGASRAEAALIVIDALEGIRENSRRHGYLVSMLGIRRVAVIVNKFDLVDFDRKVFEKIQDEYSKFLKRLGLRDVDFIPASGRDGINITKASGKTPWYKGLSVLGTIENFEKPVNDTELPFRFPVHDIYKFTAGGDDRRIVAGTVESGTICEGDKVTFYPSGKSSRIRKVERFNRPDNPVAAAGEAVGFTLEDQIYIHPGEIMAREIEQAPTVAKLFRARIFWLGKTSMSPGREYGLKLGTNNMRCILEKIERSMDASDFSTVENAEEVKRHEIAEVVIRPLSPVAFDITGDIDPTSRFVLVDRYDISGGGVTLAAVVDQKSECENREGSYRLRKGKIDLKNRQKALNSPADLILLAGPGGDELHQVAALAEERLFQENPSVFLLGFEKKRDEESFSKLMDRERISILKTLSHQAKTLRQAGIDVLLSLPDVEAEEINLLRTEHPDAKLLSVGSRILPPESCDLVLNPQIAREKNAEEIVTWLQNRPSFERST